MLLSHKMDFFKIFKKSKKERKKSEMNIGRIEMFFDPKRKQIWYEYRKDTPSPPHPPQKKLEK